jgi:hypothetical protein
MVLVTNLLHQFLNSVRSEILTAILINIQELWDVKVCFLLKELLMFLRGIVPSSSGSSILRRLC